MTANLRISDHGLAAIGAFIARLGCLSILVLGAMAIRVLANMHNSFWVAQ